MSIIKSCLLAAGLTLAMMSTVLGAGSIYIAPQANFSSIKTIIVLPDGNGRTEFDAASYLANTVKKVKQTTFVDARSFTTPPNSIEEAGTVYAGYGQALLVPYLQNYTVDTFDVPGKTVSVHLRSYEDRVSKFGTYRHNDVSVTVPHFVPGATRRLARVDMDYALYDMKGNLLFVYTQDRRNYQETKESLAKSITKNAANALKKELS